MTNMRSEVVEQFKATLRGPLLQPGDPAELGFLPARGRRPRR